MIYPMVDIVLTISQERYDELVNEAKEAGFAEHEIAEYIYNKL